MRAMCRQTCLTVSRMLAGAALVALVGHASGAAAQGGPTDLPRVALGGFEHADGVTQAEAAAAESALRAALAAHVDTTDESAWIAATGGDLSRTLACQVAPRCAMRAAERVGATVVLAPKVVPGGIDVAVVSHADMAPVVWHVEKPAARGNVPGWKRPGFAAAVDAFVQSLVDPAQAAGDLVFAARSLDDEVLVDGAPVETRRVKVAPGRAHIMWRRGDATMTQHIRVVPGQTQTLVFTPPPPAHPLPVEARWALGGVGAGVVMLGTAAIVSAPFAPAPGGSRMGEGPVRAIAGTGLVVAGGLAVWGAGIWPLLTMNDAPPTGADAADE